MLCAPKNRRSIMHTPSFARAVLVLAASCNVRSHLAGPTPDKNIARQARARAVRMCMAGPAVLISPHNHALYLDNQFVDWNADAATLRHSVLSVPGRKASQIREAVED